MSEPLYCSFCGKTNHEVRKLIAGPNTFICDGCVDLCKDIIDEDGTATHRTADGSKYIFVMNAHGYLSGKRMVVYKDALTFNAYVADHHAFLADFIPLNTETKCEFCGRSQYDGAEITSGPTTHICKDCERDVREGPPVEPVSPDVELKEATHDAPTQDG